MRRLLFFVLFLISFFHSSVSNVYVNTATKADVGTKIYQQDYMGQKLGAKKGIMKLQDVINFAYKSNPELKAAIAEKFAKDEALAQAFAEYYPDINVRLSSGRLFDRSRTKVSERGSTKLEDSVERSASTDSSAALTISQNIFNGLGTKYKLEAAEANVIANRHAVSGKIQEIILKIINAYMELWESEQRVVIAEKLVTNLKESLNSEHEKLKVGTTNVQEYEAKRSAYADAEYRLTEASARYKTSLAEFKMVTCIDAYGKTELPSLSISVPKTLEQLVNRALKNNPSLLSAKFLEYAAAKQVRVSKAELSPRVDLELSAVRDIKNDYGRRWSSEIARPTNANNGRQPVNRHGSLAAKINVYIPILKDGGRSYSNIRQTNQSAIKAAFDYKSAVLNIERECRSVWSVYLASLDQIEQSRRAVKSATVTVEGFKKSEELGKVSATDVIYNERNLLERRQQFVEAKKKNIVNTYRVISCMGDLENIIKRDDLKYDLQHNEQFVRYAPVETKVSNI